MRLPPCTLSPRYGLAALDAAGEKPHSNFGAGWISPPGGGAAGKILQETIDPETGKWCFWLPSTSMAAPHVAGVAALVKAEGT